MASGGRKLIQNTREKVLSTDMNRRQDLASSDAAELWRFLLNIGRTSFELSSALDESSIPLTIGTPLRADIWHGLTVIPIEGTLSVHIVQGVIGMHDPDGQAGSSDPASPNPDDSVYKIVKSAGIQTTGVLEFVANASGSIRIDIVECQRVTNITEQDNRDIFNPGTGLFTPALVSKVEDGELTFRIREGVGGAGIPANVQGWLPLAVASVPNNFTNTDDITFWDVRPVIGDRGASPFRNVSGFVAPMTKNQAHVDINFSGGGVALLTGVLEREVPIAGFMGGGRITRGSVNGIDLNDVVNQDPGFGVPALGTFVYLWACFPLGLPRWVRYVDTSVDGRREPLGPKGILVLSTIAPSTALTPALVPSAPIVMPTETGLAVSTTVAANLLAFPFAGGTVPQVVVDGSWTYFGAIVTVVAPPVLVSGAFTFDEYLLSQGVHYPAGAQAIRGFVGMSLSGGVGSRFQLEMEASTFDLAGGALINQVTSTGSRTEIGSIDSGGVATIRADFEVPRIYPPSGVSSANIGIKFQWNVIIAGGGTKAIEFLQVNAWKMAD